MNEQAIKKLIVTIMLGLEGKIGDIKSEINQIKSDMPDLNKVLDSIKGQDGKTPVYGEDWVLSDEEVNAIVEQVKPIEGVDYFIPKDGKDAEITPELINKIVGMVQSQVKNGRDGKDGIDGLDGRDGKDGKDGSPDTAEQVADKLNTLENKIDWKVLKDFNSLVSQDTLKGAISTLENQTRFLIQSNSNKSSGGGGGITEVVAGANVSVDNTDPTKPIVSSLSDRYKTSSTTSQTIVSTGSLTFTVDAGLAYIPQQDVIIVYDSSNHMHGTITSYSGTTMVVDITHKTGSGTYASWVINLDGTPVASSVAFADITGNPTDNTALATALNGKWSTTGNAGTNPATNFIGTTDAQDLVFKRNSAEVFRLKSTALELTTGKILRSSSSGIELRRTDDTGGGTSYGTIQYTTDDFITFNKGIRTGTGIYGNSNFSTNSVSLNLGYGYSVFKTPGAGTGSVEFEIKSGSTALQPMFRVTNNTTTSFQVSQNNNVQIGTTTDAGFKLEVNGTGIFRDVLTIQKSGNSQGILLQANTSGDYYSPHIQFKGAGGNLSTISLDYNNLVIGSPYGSYVGFGLVGQAGDYSVTINAYPYGVNAAPNNFVQRITTTENSAVGLVIKNQSSLSPSPTGNFLEFRNASNTVLSGFRSNGNFFAVNGTAPTTSVTDTFAMYANDITAGNAAPHFRTENGSIIKLYKNSAVTTAQGIANVLTNLGLLDTSTIAGGSSYTFSNGLTDTSGTVTLGGTLGQTTTIDGGFTIAGNTVNYSNKFIDFTTGESIASLTDSALGKTVTRMMTTDNYITTVENTTTQFKTTVEQVPQEFSVIAMDTNASVSNDFRVQVNDLLVSAYPNTRDDTGSVSIDNVLYTDSVGVHKSAPLSAKQFPVAFGTPTVTIPDTRVKSGNVILCTFEDTMLGPGSGNAVVLTVSARTPGVDFTVELVPVGFAAMIPSGFINYQIIG